MRTSVVETLADLAAAAGVPIDGFAAVGMGIPGLVDREAGTVRHAVNLGLGEEPLAVADHVADLARAPVVVDNDVNVAAVGAASALGCPGDLAYLSVGTGVAAGFVLGGRIRQGAHGAAGEIGHLPVDPGGPLCECGQRGLSRPSPRAPHRQALAVGWWRSVGGVGAAGRGCGGDGVAAEVRDEVAAYLAGAVALIAQTVDPQIIVLGGAWRRRAHRCSTPWSTPCTPGPSGHRCSPHSTWPAGWPWFPEGVPAGASGAALLARAHLAADSVRTAANSAGDGLRGG